MTAPWARPSLSATGERFSNWRRWQNLLAPLEIRDERPDDVVAIRKVNELAFGQPDEARIVDAGRVVGHILFSPVSISAPARTISAIGLAPMAVLPKLQKQGIGSLLVRQGLARLEKDGHKAVVVLGHPEYYPRFGFVRLSDHLKTGQL